MKSIYIVAIVAALVLSGCDTIPNKQEIVYVDKPVAFIPPPPNLPKIEYQVDKLTDADVNDPGKVGQAYKYDMTALRAINKILTAIVDQYKKSSVDFTQIEKDIAALAAKSKASESAPGK